MATLNERTATSADLLRLTRAVIPGASQTISKGPSQWIEGVAPVFARAGEGAYLIDVEDRRYIDLPMGLGAVLLGYAHPAVTEAVARQAALGVAFTLPHVIEREVAELIVECAPGVEMVRFAKNGSDATSGAVRAARALTGRDRVAYAGYHGWHDWHIGATARGHGVPGAVRELTHGFAFNDAGSLRAQLDAHPGEFAVVILEPSAAVEPDAGFLEAVRDLAHAAGALLVFDEVVTGFRLALGGAQERYGVTADLVCFGKGLANGLPLAAVGGRRELMEVFDEGIFFSGTHGGETLSLAAAQAVIGVLREPGTYERLWQRGTALAAAIRASVTAHGLDEVVSVTGAAPRFIVAVTEPDDTQVLRARSLVQQELAKRHVLFNGTHNISLAHDETIMAAVAEAYDQALEVLARCWPDGIDEVLEGPAIAPAFRRV